MYRIGRRRRYCNASCRGVDGGILPLMHWCSNQKGQCQAGSLTGAVASQRVTEAPKDTLSLDGNQAQSAKAEGCLTARQTGRAGTKVGLSDPAVPNGRAVAQRIKATLGITG